MEITQALLQGLPLPVVVIGRDSRIELLNPPAVAMLGADMAGRHYMSALRQPEIVSLVDRVLGGGAQGAAYEAETSGPIFFWMPSWS
jgi:two-component system phosphate regulon sensor histidine kinase PhoR